MIIIYMSGIDGCGKTTQAKLLVDSLIKEGYNAKYKWLRWEPFFQKLYRLPKLLFKKKETTTAQHIVDVENIEHRQWADFKKKLLSNAIFRKLWWLHASADYYFQTQKRLKNLPSEILVVDRYLDDFIIDQAINFGSSPDAYSKEILSGIFIKKFKEPDYKIFIHLPAEVGYKRKSDGTPLAYLKERECYYKNISHTEDTLYLDGKKEIKVLAREIADWVIDKLNMRKK